MKTIDDFNFNGKRALIRVDFNVPLDKKTFAVADDTRIKAAVPTIKKILRDGGSAVLMSHLGRPLKKLKEDGTVDYNKHSLKHAVSKISELLGTEVMFADDCIGEASFELSKNLEPGAVLLLENLRFYKEEEKGIEDFAQRLARHGNVYVNDAFGTAHRAHASTAVIAKFFPNAKMFGYVMAAEIKNAEKVMSAIERPYTAVMGGAKVSDKILIIERLMDKVNDLIIGGAMMFTFEKARGGKIGKSLCEDDKLDLALKIIEMAKQKKVNLHLPVDAVAGDNFSNAASVKTVSSSQIPDAWMGLDIGPESCNNFSEVIKKSKTILWNGPMGVFEMPKFENGTKQVAESIAEATRNGAFSLIGGGDSAAAINKFNMADKVSYVSTGGGALLEYMEGKELPGIAAILS